MSKTRSRFSKLVRKTLRVGVFTILALVILINLFILLSGRTYLYKGIASTYLVGESGPTIYDLDKFAYRTIQKGSVSIQWKQSSAFNKQQLSPRFEAYNKEWESTAFLVFRGDSILFEKYWGDHTAQTVSNSFSAAKTVVALLIGVAVDEGAIQSIDDPVGNYIPEFKSGDKALITIRDLLLMASGLDWSESGKNPLSNNAESYYGSDLYGLVTGQHVERKPGKEFIYQSGNSQLLGFVLKQATGKSIAEYASEKLWSKIGVESDAYWSLDKEGGDEKAFCCLYATARDFGKIGRLILQRGRWETEQVIPEWYMTEMVTLPEGMLTDDGVANHQYGLHIWIYEGHTSPVYYCRGIKGQYIIAIPEENLVIVRLGSRRAPNIEVPKDRFEIKKQLPYIGHPEDLQEYINFAASINEQSSD